MNSIQNKIYHEWFLRPDKLCVSVSHRGRPVAVLKVLEMLPDFLSSPRVFEVKCENLIDLF